MADDTMITKDTPIALKDRQLFHSAWQKARDAFGRDFTFYLPGMIRYGDQRGRYPALSITGKSCELMCEHCRGRLLEPMIQIEAPEDLVAKCRRLKRAGACGILLSGGSDRQGRLPWPKYTQAIQRVKEDTDFFISAHVGFPDLETCRGLKNAGVRQALLDVMGDQNTASRVYHLENIKTVEHALESISESGLPLVPHIVAGLLYGRIKGEYQALDIIGRHEPAALVVVVLTPLKGTPMAGVEAPAPVEVARLMANARLLMPETPIALGCERPRNKDGLLLERLALLAGANRMAVWSEDTVKLAEELGLRPRFQPTCCSVPFRNEFAGSLNSQ
jgi:uncharacterized radical SAM superfamily protein